MTLVENWPLWLTNCLCLPGIEKDAVIIFTKYISPDAVRPIPISEQTRNDIVGKRQAFFKIRNPIMYTLVSMVSAPVSAAKICGEDGMVDPNCFVTAQLVVINILEQQ